MTDQPVNDQPMSERPIAGEPVGDQLTPDERRSALQVVRGSRVIATILGVLSLGAGIALLVWPDRTVTVVARLVGVLLVVLGIGDLLDTFRNHEAGAYRALLVLHSVVNVGFGVALIAWSGPTLRVLVWLVGIDMLVTGVIGLIVSRQLPKEFQRVTVIRSVLTVIFGIVIIAWPSATLSAIAFLVGSILAVFGVVLLWTAYELARVKVV